MPQRRATSWWQSSSSSASSPRLARTAHSTSRSRSNAHRALAPLSQLWLIEMASVIFSTWWYHPDGTKRISPGLWGRAAVARWHGSLRARACMG
eukprot:165227-Prymnesium_polylepis.1